MFIYSRLKNADSILSKYSLAVADTSKSNVVLSSARFIPEVSLLQDATEATRNDRKGASFSSSFSRGEFPSKQSLLQLFDRENVY